MAVPTWRLVVVVGRVEAVNRGLEDDADDEGSNEANDDSTDGPPEGTTGLVADHPTSDCADGQHDDERVPCIPDLLDQGSERLHSRPPIYALCKRRL